MRRVFTWAAACALGAGLVAWMWNLHGPRFGAPLLFGLAVIGGCMWWEYGSDMTGEKQRMAERNRRLDRAWLGYGPLFEHDIAHHNQGEQ